MTRPLDGIFVLDFSTLLPGPMAGLMLAEAGAEVVKVEAPPKGEGMRGYTPQWGPYSINFALLNRGKKSLTVDLKDKAQLEKLLELVKRADVILEQFRPGVMARLGLGYEAVSKINPKIIYCSITGYGQNGPMRDVAAHDLNYTAHAGLLGLSMGTPDSRTLPPALIADIAGGAYPAVMNILLALRQRDTSGKGCYLDMAMAENVLPFMYWAMGDGLVSGEWPKNGKERVTGGTARFHIYTTKDGRAVAAAPLEQKFWENFCAIIGLEENFRNDDANPEATITRVAEIIRSNTAANWATKFEGRDCCCNIVQNVEEALNDQHFASRGVFAHRVKNADGAVLPALPMSVAPHFRGDPDDIQEPPILGAHNKEYLP